MKRGLIMTLMLCAATPALAQDGWGWSIIIPSVTGTDQLGTVLRENRAQQEADAAGQSSAPPAAKAPAAATASLRYAPSKQRRAKNLGDFVARARKVDPAGAKQLETLFASGDIIDQADQQLRTKNLRADDLADVYTVWWITAWQATRGITDDTSDATNEAVRRQSRDALIEVGLLANAGDAIKQEMAESLLLNAMLLEAALEQAKGQPDLMPAVNKAATQGARRFGLDLASMELTDRGFVIR